VILGSLWKRERLLLAENGWFDGPTTFTWTKSDDDADFVVGTKKVSGANICPEKDQLLLHCDEVRIEDREYGEVMLTFRYDRAPPTVILMPTCNAHFRC